MIQDGDWDIENSFRDFIIILVAHSTEAYYAENLPEQTTINKGKFVLPSKTYGMSIEIQLVCTSLNSMLDWMKSLLTVCIVVCLILKFVSVLWHIRVEGRCRTVVYRFKSDELWCFSQ